MGYVPPPMKVPRNFKRTEFIKGEPVKPRGFLWAVIAKLFGRKTESTGPK